VRDFSVVVPVRDAARTLPMCLRALGRLDPPPSELLLVDNGSQDASTVLLRRFDADRPRVRILEETTPGASAARNRGIREARGEIVAFTDADCTPEPDWLQRLSPPFDDAGVGAVAGRVVPATPQTTLELFNALYTLRSPSEPGRFERWTPRSGGFPTANLAVRRGLLEALDGFDETIEIYGEDHDLCARLYQQGAAITYTPEARVAHHHRVRLQPMLRQAFGFGRSHPWLLRHHGTGLWLDLPGVTTAWESAPVTAWLDLAGADKKLVATLLAAGLTPVLLPLPILYSLWLLYGCSRRVMTSARLGLPLAGLLLLKSAALSLGRLWGSLRRGALCV